MRQVVLALALLAAIAATPATAAPIPDAAWKAFAEDAKTYGTYGNSDMEIRLSTAAAGNDTQDAAMAEFASGLGVDTALAEDYAALIFQARDYVETCGEDCAFAPGVPLYDRLARMAPGDASGGLLAAIGGLIGDENDDAFIRLAWSHPAATTVLLDVADATGNVSMTGAALIRMGNDPAMTGVLSGSRWATLPESYPEAPDTRNGYVQGIAAATLARLEALPDDTSGLVDWKLDMSAYLASQELWLGLDAEAIDRYRTTPGLRESLLHNPLMSDRMIAALWHHGDRDEALALMKAARADIEPRDTPDTLADALVPSIPATDLFDAYVTGERMQALSRETPAFRQAVAKRLGDAGYADMAACLGKPAWHYLDTAKQEVLPGLKDLMPADVLAQQAVWAQRIIESQVREAVPVAKTIHVTSTQLPAWWTEKPLPAGVQPWNEDDRSAAVPMDIQMPVSPDVVLRYEGNDKDSAIVYESSQYDAAGEIAAYGLWFARKKGGVWQRPLYLGLQSYFPYVATPASHLPLIDGDRLHLEVLVREIDTKTITFPPVGLGYSREQDGLYLDIALADLARDSDADGLTDIEEARIGLMPDNTDSDGDGMEDGKDALPLTAFEPNADPAQAELGRAILERVIGYDEGAIVLKPRSANGSGDMSDLLASIQGTSAPDARRHTVFLVSDTDIFSGILDAPTRLIVYSSGDLKHLGRGDAPFYPPQITQMFRSLDGKRTFVEWSAGWVGGSFVVTCEGGACTSVSQDDWIS